MWCHPLTANILSLAYHCDTGWSLSTLTTHSFPMSLSHSPTHSPSDAHHLLTCSLTLPTLLLCNTVWPLPVYVFHRAVGAHLLTHSPIHPFTHSLTDWCLPFTHSLAHSLNHSLTHSLTDSLARSLTHSLTQWCPPFYSLTHSLADIINPAVMLYCCYVILCDLWPLSVLLFHRAVGNILDNLHGVAVDMGDELDRQNAQLGRINKKADVNVGHIASANQRMKRQL